MNRKLLVTLLHKNIEELNVITEGFMEMDEYPAAIIHLAKRKTEDIQTIIDELTTEKLDQPTNNMPYINVDELDKPVSTTLSESIAEKELNEVEAELTSIINIVPKSATLQLTQDFISAIPEIVVAEPEPETFVEESIPEPASEELKVEDSIEVVAESSFVAEPETIVEPEIAVEPEIIIEPEIEKSAEVVFEKQEDKIIVDELSDINAAVVKSTEHVEIKITPEEHKRVIIGERIISPTVSRNEILAKGDNSLSASIANKKITDIKQAINIGDRFRFQRELFKGNGEEMNRTLNYINQLATFDEASSFLMSKYGWNETNENVQDFLQLVRRRF